VSATMQEKYLRRSEWLMAAGQQINVEDKEVEMTRVYSRYKIFGGFGLVLALNITVGFGAYKLLTSSKISIDKVDLLNNNGALFAYAVILGLLFLPLVPFITQNRFIIADKNGITFINPLLPIFRATYNWTDFDYYMKVEESSQHATHEAVWLVKNGRLKARFSSFYYTNFEDLADEIRATKKGYGDFSPFEQLFVLIGLKKVGEK
jgi:hypothetical protein